MDKDLDPLGQTQSLFGPDLVRVRLRREACLEPQEAVQVSSRRLLLTEGLHPDPATIAGYGGGESADEIMAELLLESMIPGRGVAWSEGISDTTLRQIDGKVEEGGNHGRRTGL